LAAKYSKEYLAAPESVREEIKKAVVAAASGGDVNISGGIQINTQAKDPDAIAKEIFAAIKRQTKQTGKKKSP